MAGARSSRKRIENHFDNIYANEKEIDEIINRNTIKERTEGKEFRNDMQNMWVGRKLHGM